MKNGQKVRIKGTAIEGVFNAAWSKPGRANIDAPDGTDFYVPAELVEPIQEPIKVEFDPVELPATANGTFRDTPAFQVTSDGREVNVEAFDTLGRQAAHRSLSKAEARKLAFAILTITEGTEGRDCCDD